MQSERLMHIISGSRAAGAGPRDSVQFGPRKVEFFSGCEFHTLRHTGWRAVHKAFFSSYVKKKKEKKDAYNIIKKISLLYF